MKKTDKEIIKEAILKEITKTEESVKDYKEMTQPIAPENAIGRVSRMDAINNKSVMEASLRKAQEKLKALNYLKEHIDDDDFGLCAKCRNSIPVGRLLLRPESRFCVNCAR